jgi:hypothetical protein
VSKEVNYTIQYASPPADTASQSIPWTNFNAWEPYAHGVIKSGTLRIRGEAIDPSRDYRIATTSELATGAYYTILAQRGTNARYTTDFFWQGVAEYIYEHGQIAPASPANTSACRIVIEGGIPLGALGRNICNFDQWQP